MSSKCKEYLRDRYRNQKVVEDTWLDTSKPFHIPRTILCTKKNTRIKKDCPNVPDFCKGPDKETCFPIKITEILQFDTDRKDRKFVLLEGAPGSGKSTYARDLCRLWAEDRIGEEYDLFIMIPLRMLKSTDCSDISDLLGSFGFPETLKEAAVKEISAHNGSKVLFLFEGWDECPQNCAIVHKIVDGHVLPASSIIITSHYNSAGELYKKIDRRIELAPFSPSDRKAYIEKYFDSEEKSDSLISLLTNNPDLESLCSYPMMLSMICFIHHNDECKALSTTTGVYDGFLCLVVNRYLREKKECSESEVEAASDVLKYTSLSGFHQYTKLALKGVQTHKFAFENEDLKKWDIQFDLTRDWERTGIVLKYIQVNKKGCEGISYQFLHDSMQCFLAALEMSEYTTDEQLQILKSCIKSLFAVYSSEEDEYLGQLDDHRYKQQYSEELDSSQKYEPKLSDPQPLFLQFFAGVTGLNNPAIASTLIEESRKGAHDQWSKSALPLILYESQNKELTKNVMREVLKPQIVVSCQDDFHLRCTAWCMAQAESLRKVEELTIILREHIRLQHFLDTCNDASLLKTLTIDGSVSTSGE